MTASDQCLRWDPVVHGDHLAGCGRHLGELAVVDLEIGGVVGVDEKCASVATFHQHIDVVHPRVVRPQLAAPNEQIPAIGFDMGQMNPGEKTLSRSPRMRRTASSLIVISRPQVASHRGRFGIRFGCRQQP